MGRFPRPCFVYVSTLNSTLSTPYFFLQMASMRSWTVPSVVYGSLKSFSFSASESDTPPKLGEFLKTPEARRRHSAER